MTKYREILHLASLGLSQQSIRKGLAADDTVVFMLKSRAGLIAGRV